MVPLTQRAHERVAAIVLPGETVVDATAGNGHDTLFLAQLVGLEGTVFAIDLQARALAQTRERCAALECRNLSLIQGDHAEIQSLIPQRFHQKIAAVMFNLGYLPGSDRQIVTTPRTTLTALKAALPLLRPGGILTITAYRGHPGGLAESQALESWLQTESGLCTEVLNAEFDSETAPRLYLVQPGNRELAPGESQ